MGDYYPYTDLDDKLRAYKQAAINKIEVAVHPDHLEIARKQLDCYEKVWREGRKLTKKETKKMTDDLKRELQKVQEAVKLAAEYHTKINEANSKLHCSDTVLHSPMTNKLILAQQSLERILQDA